jgi:hypothetical protein
MLLADVDELGIIIVFHSNANVAIIIGHICDLYILALAC